MTNSVNFNRIISIIGGRIISGEGHTCYECGGTSSAQVITFGDTYQCISCAELEAHQVSQCSSCGCADLENIEFGTYPKQYFCEKCFAEEQAKATCHFCSSREVFSVNNKIWCCDDCYAENFVTCDCCGKQDVFINDSFYNEDSEMFFCDNCYYNVVASSIEQYRYKPEAVFFRTQYDEEEKRFFGVELETVTYEEEPEEFYNFKAFRISQENHEIYIKKDGSLVDKGFEIVTHPCTLKYHMTTLDWDGICYSLSEFDSNPLEAGLHVHVSRGEFNKYDIINMMSYFDYFWDEIIDFSQRVNMTAIDRYCRRNQVIDFILSGWHPDKIINHYSDDRYYAVNVTNNDTIEFRIFNGTTDSERIIDILSFVNEVCDICKGIEPTDFIDKLDSGEIKFIR